MTLEEFKKVPFRLMSSLSMGDGHTLTYSSKDGKFGYAIFTPTRNGKPKGEPQKAWRIKDKWYEDFDEFVEALKAYRTCKVVQFKPKERKE